MQALLHLSFALSHSGLRLLQAIIAEEHLHGYSIDFDRYSCEVAR
jgi:hypothetical protein